MSQSPESRKGQALQFEVVHDEDAYEKEELGVASQEAQNAVPMICGLPLKYVSYVVHVPALRCAPEPKRLADIVLHRQARDPRRPKRYADAYHALFTRVCRAVADILCCSGRATHGTT